MPFLVMSPLPLLGMREFFQNLDVPVVISHLAKLFQVSRSLDESFLKSVEFFFLSPFYFNELLAVIDQGSRARWRTGWFRDGRPEAEEYV